MRVGISSRSTTTKGGAHPRYNKEASQEEASVEQIRAATVKLVDGPTDEAWANADWTTVLLVAPLFVAALAITQIVI